MQLPLQVSFRYMELSEEIESIIRGRAAKLDTFADRIMSCRVVVEQAARHHRHGNLHHVKIDITVPGGEVIATQEADEHLEYKDIHVAVRDAFDAAQRQLQDHVRRHRRDVKTHTPSA